MNLVWFCDCCKPDTVDRDGWDCSNWKNKCNDSDCLWFSFNLIGKCREFKISNKYSLYYCLLEFLVVFTIISLTWMHYMIWKGALHYLILNDSWKLVRISYIQRLLGEIWVLYQKEIENALNVLKGSSHFIRGCIQIHLISFLVQLNI